LLAEDVALSKPALVKDRAPPFIATTSNDPDGNPEQARKFAARLEQLSEKYYFRESPTGGHHPCSGLDACAKYEALAYTYLSRQLFPASALNPS
jgi:prolyl oligopeptidase